MKPINKYLVNRHISAADIRESDFVNLGLPSGTLWCKKNVGAKDETDPGDYYMWGSIDTDDNNTIVSPGDLPEKYVKNNDAAYITSKGVCVIPTVEQCQELIDNTTREYDEKTQCIIFMADNGNFITIPLGGYISQYGGPKYVSQRNHELDIHTTHSSNKFSRTVMTMYKNDDTPSIDVIDKIIAINIRGVKVK